MKYNITMPEQIKTALIIPDYNEQARVCSVVEAGLACDDVDEVIVVNAGKVKITGNKNIDKTYKRYTAYPGGLHLETLEAKMKGNPEYVIRHAVKGMLPKSKLGAKLLKKLKVYAGEDHPHKAQNPKVLTV